MMTKDFSIPKKTAEGSNGVPDAVKTAFAAGADFKNANDPSGMKASALERLPQPTGYRVLIIPYYPDEKTRGGLLIPDSVRDQEAFASVAAYVVKLGPDAYKDPDKFPSGPWCREKEWVLIGRYSGNRFKVEGLEVRIINDDNIIASILDPKDISYV